MSVVGNEKRDASNVLTIELLPATRSMDPPNGSSSKFRAVSGTEKRGKVLFSASVIEGDIGAMASSSLGPTLDNSGYPIDGPISIRS